MLSLARDNGSSKFLRGRTGTCCSTLFLSKSSDRISPELWVVLFLLIRNRTLNRVLLRYINDIKSKQLFVGYMSFPSLLFATIRHLLIFTSLYFFLSLQGSCPSGKQESLSRFELKFQYVTFSSMNKVSLSYSL